jgi:hypothetical protein
VPHTKLDNVPLIDKWTHMVMYAGTTSIFWFEYWRNFRHHFHLSERMLWIISVVLPILMSGLIEILQATCTGGRRSGEFLDFFANSIGVGFGLVFGRTFIKMLVEKYVHK